MKNPTMEWEVKEPSNNYDIFYEIECRKLESSVERFCLYIDYDLAKKDFDELVDKCVYVLLNKVKIDYDSNKYEVEELEGYERKEK